MTAASRRRPPAPLLKPGASKTARQRALQHVLRETFGVARLRPGQAEAIDAVLAGRHVFAVMPTGAGKSLCCQLPALLGLPRTRRRAARARRAACAGADRDRAELIEDIARQLGLADWLLVDTGVYRENLHLRAEAFERERDRQERIGTLVRGSEGPGIVYAASVKMAQQVHAGLAASGESVALYHARLAAAKRREAQDRFMAGEVRVMVATDAFGLGIDKADLRFVLHCQLPASLDAYYQESGRAGRDGAATCSLLYHAKDRALQQFFMAGRYPGLDELRAVCQALHGPAPDGGRWRMAALKRALDHLPADKLQIALALLRAQGAALRRRPGDGGRCADRDHRVSRRAAAQLHGGLRGGVLRVRVARQRGA